MNAENILENFANQLMQSSNVVDVPLQLGSSNFHTKQELDDYHKAKVSSDSTCPSTVMHHYQLISGPYSPLWLQLYCCIIDTFIVLFPKQNLQDSSDEFRLLSTFNYILKCKQQLEAHANASVDNAKELDELERTDENDAIIANSDDDDDDDDDNDDIIWYD